MAQARLGHYRRLARLALQWALEPVDGQYSDPSRPSGMFARQFDPAIIDFRLDVDRILRHALSWPEYVALILVHRDGLTCEEAVAAAAVYDPEWQHGRPDNRIGLIEHQAGLALAQAGIRDIRTYFRPLNRT